MVYEFFNPARRWGSHIEALMGRGCPGHTEGVVGTWDPQMFGQLVEEWRSRVCTGGWRRDILVDSVACTCFSGASNKACCKSWIFVKSSNADTYRDPPNSGLVTNR